MRRTDVSKDDGLAEVSVSGDVCVIEFRGHITGKVVGGAVARLKTTIATQPVPFLVIDGTAIDRRDTPAARAMSASGCDQAMPSCEAIER